MERDEAPCDVQAGAMAEGDYSEHDGGDQGAPGAIVTAL
jgi:hypothetical protein